MLVVTIQGTYPDLLPKMVAKVDHDSTSTPPDFADYFAHLILDNIAVSTDGDHAGTDFSGRSRLSWNLR